MAAIVLTLTLTLIVAGCAWLALGTRIALADDPRQNDIFNLLAYAAVTLVVVFPFVFFVIERL